MTLPVMEFMRRFLQHVLPRGFHKIRYYGILSPANQSLLARVRLAMVAHQTTSILDPEPDNGSGCCSFQKVETNKCKIPAMLILISNSCGTSKKNSAFQKMVVFVSDRVKL